MRRRMFCVALATLVGVLGLPSTPPATATAFLDVDTTLDVVDPTDGLLSLREAVTEANNLAGGDVITLESGQTYQLTICGAVPNGEEDANADGDLDATDPDSLTINGNGSTIEQTCDAERVIEAAGGAGLALIRLTITGGEGDGAEGVAAGATNGGRLALERTVVSGNHATVGSSFPPVGIVARDYSSLIAIWDSQVVDNTGAAGVGANGDETGLIRRSVVSRNVNPEGEVGGVYGNVDVIDSEISDNSADKYGGGWLFGDITNSTIVRNTGSHAGGLIGSGTIIDSLISENHATTIGGGVTGGWTIRRTTISNNTSDFFGGGAILTGELEDSTVSGNEAKAGGGIGFANLTVRRSTITDNTAIRGAGAFAVEPHPFGPTSALALEDSTLAGNIVVPGPGVGAPAEIAFYTGDPPTPQSWTAQLSASRSVIGDGSIPGCDLQDGTVISDSYNFWSDESCAPPPTAGDVVNGGNATLGALQDNGGATETRLPLPGSPLRDRIPLMEASCSGVDQRGAPRPQGLGCDIGATEVEVLPSGFVGMTPTRILDTRTSPTPAGWPSGQKLAASGSIDVTVAGPNGVPAGVTAVVLNVTSTEAASALAYVSAWPTGQPPPSTSALNLQPGANVANSLTIAPGVGGKITLSTNAGSTHLVIDVLGYYVSGSGDRFKGTSPHRILDTRTGYVPPPRFVGQKLSGGETLQLPISVAVVPPLATAVVVNITSTEATSDLAYVTAWPSGQPKPTASNVNLQPQYNVSNLAFVKIGADGAINFYNSAGATHLVVDIVGYFQPYFGDGFMPVNPTRLVDSRSGPPLDDESIYEAQIADNEVVPADASSVVLNATATQASSNGGYLTVYGKGTVFPPPTASNLNYRPPFNTPNQVVTAVGDDDSIELVNGFGTVHIVLDVSGYFTAWY